MDKPSSGMAEIPALPGPARLHLPSTALVVIDLQVDFMEEGGWADAIGLDIAQLTSVIDPIRRLLGAFRAAGLPILFTREGFRPDLADYPAFKRKGGGVRVGDVGPRGRYMITGEPCNDIIDSLRPLPEEAVIDKPGAGAFYATMLDHILRLQGVRQLVITGVTTDVCVNTTIREANDRGYECLLVEDATASYDPAFTAAIIAMLRTGIAGASTTSDKLIPAVEAMTRMNATVG